MRALLSPEPVANKGFLPGLVATEITIGDESATSFFNARLLLSLPEFLWPCNMNSVWPVRGSQNCTPRSFDPDTIHFPSGVVATDNTKS